MDAHHPFLQYNARHAADPAVRGPARPSHRIVIVTCMDARVDPRDMLGLGPGEAHVLRNAGGAVTDDVIRSVAVSQRLLDTRAVMVIQHTDCGMMSATDDELKDAIAADAGIRPPFAMETFSDLDEHIKESVERIVSSPFVPHTDDVSGFAYDVESGLLRRVV